MISANGASDIIIDGISFEGFGLAKNIISLANCRRIRLSHIDLRGAGGHGLRLEGCGGSVHDCIIAQCGDAGILALDSSGLEIARNTISSCGNNGILVNNNTGGTVNFAGPVTLSTSGANAVELTNNTGAAVNFSGGLIVNTSSGGGIQATGGGALTVTDSALLTNSITTTGGRAISLDAITIGDAGLTLDTVNVTAGQYGLYFDQVGQTASSTGIDILDGSIAVSQNTGVAVWLQNSSADIFVGADLSSTGSANSTVNVSGNGRAGGQAIEFAGLVDENTLGITLANNDQNGGYADVTFSGTVDIDTAPGASYGLSQSDGGNLSVTGQMTVDTVGSTNGAQLQNNTGSTFTFNSSGTGLDISTAGGTGLLYTGGGTLAVLGSGNTIETATGNIVDLQNGAIGASGVTFASLTATGTASLPFFAYRITGGTFDGGNLSIAGASGLAAMQVLESSADFAFDSIDILSTAANGIIDNANTGDLTVTGKTTVVAGSYAGVRLEQNHGTIDFGETEINGVAAGVRGLALGGTFDGSISFDSLAIALTGAGAMGVDMHNAVVNANVTATDFDLTSTSATGTIGIDLTGASGSGTVQFGDASTPYGAGQNATISGVATGVILNDASDINFIFGDGEGTIDVGSSIAAATAIDFTDATGANGTFNFLDVTFPTAGSTANLESSVDVYWIDADGDGDGTKTNPGSFDDAAALSADVLVLANTNGLTTDTIDLASAGQGSIGTYTLQDGQVLASFNGSDSLDLTDYGFSSGGGAPANLLLTNIATGGTTLTNPYSGMTPELDSFASPAGIIQLADGSTTWIDGVVFGDSGSALAAISGTAFESFTLTNSAIYSGGLGLALRLDLNALASASQVTIRDSFIQSGGTALLFSSGAGDSLTLDLANVHARGTGGAALDVSNASTGDISLGLDGFIADGYEGIRLAVGAGATGDFIVTDFANLTVDANSGTAVDVAGLATNWIKFDAVPGTPALDAINAGNLTIGADGSASGGLSLTNVAGQLDFGDIDIQTTGGAGLNVNNSALKAAQPSLDFTLTSTGGTINSAGAPALVLDPLTVDLVFDSVSSSGGGNGIWIDEVAGSLTINGGAITGTTANGVRLNASTLDFDFAGTIANAAGRAVEIAGQSAGTVAFSGAIDAVGTGILLSGNTGATIGFTGGLDIDTTINTGFTASGGGTLSITGTNTIDTTTGQILNLDGISAGVGGISFASLTSTGVVATHAVYLNNLDGTSFSGGDVTVAATSSGNGIFVTGGSAATFDFGTAIIGTTGAVNSIANAGIYLYGANGSVTFDSVDIDGFQNWGLRIDGNSNAVNVNGGTINGENLSGAAGVLLNGGSGNVAIVADVTKTFNQSAYVVQVSGRTAGTATFSGDISALTPGSGGIGLTNNSGGAINFTGTVTLDTFNNNAIDFTNTSATGAAVTFSGGLGITTTSGRGINVTSTTAGAGSLAITGSGNTIQTTTGQILNLSNISAGTGGINFASLTSGTVANNHAIRINNLDGTSFSGGAVTIGGTTGGGHGIYITGGSGATFTFASATMDNIAGDGIYVEGSPPNTTGNVAFGTVDLDSVTGSGVHLSLLGSNFAINGGAIGATDDPDGFAGVFIDGGAGEVSIAASIVKDNSYAVEVNAKSAGTTTFSGNITAQSGSSGIFLNANTGGTINFTGQSISVNTGVNTGVNLTNNTGAVINFAPLTGGNGLDIITTSGTGFNATGGGTVTVAGSSNTIASTGGIALNVSNTNIGAAGITFESISANGGTRGIVLNTTGSAAGLTITGTGTTDGSGGTIQNITQRGIELINTAQVNIANLNLTNASTTGQAAGQDLDLTTANGTIYMSGVSTAVFDNINITGTIADNGITGINVSNFQLNNSLITGAGDGAHESGIEFSNLSGTSSLTNTEIAFSETNSLDIVNTDVNLNLTLNNVIFRDTQSSTTNGEGGLQFRSFSSAAGAPVTNIDIIDSDFLRLRTQAIQVIGEDDSVVNVDITNNVIDSGTGIGAGIDINGNDTATVQFNIVGNSTIRSSGGAAINVSSFVNANVMGRIANNANINVYSQNPAGTGASGSGVRLLAQENSHLTVAVTGNNLTQGAGNNSAAVDVIAREGSARLDLTLTGNIITQTDAATLAAINLQSGSSSGSNVENNQIYANIANNNLTVPGGINLLRLRVSELDNAHDPRIFLQGFVEGGAGLDDDAVATWNANGNTPGATTANIAVSLSGTATAPSAGTAQTPTNPLP